MRRAAKAGRAALSLVLALSAALSGCRVAIFFGNDVSFLEITPANPTLPIGSTLRFTAVAVFRDGLRVVLTPAEVQWSSSSPAVAAIDSTGTATALRIGTTLITAREITNGRSGSTTLGVTATAPKVLIGGTAERLEVSFAGREESLVIVAHAPDNAIAVFRADVRGETLAQEISVAPARGPVWLALDPSGRFLYTADALTENVSGFALDPTGRLHEIAGSPFAAPFAPWVVQVDAAGELLTVKSLEGTTARFRIDAASGALAPALDAVP